MFEKIIFTLHYLKVVLKTFLHRNFLWKKSGSFSSKEKEILKELCGCGISVIEGYWTKEQCERVKNIFEKKVSTGKSVDFESGAYMRVRNKDLNFDNGITRIYHADKEVDELDFFRFDKDILKIVRAYYGYPVYSSFVAFQHNKPTIKGTRDYHVDGWVDEFKAFLYLEDVCEKKGPFAYLRGSNNAFYKRFKRMVKRFDGIKPDTSFSKEETGGFSKKEMVVSGKAGTLILADVSGFHRGMSQKNTTRSLLYNNFYSKDMEMFLEK